MSVSYFIPNWIEVVWDSKSFHACHHSLGDLTVNSTSRQLKCQVGNIELIMYLECVMIQPVIGVASILLIGLSMVIVSFPKKKSKKITDIRKLSE